MKLNRLIVLSTAFIIHSSLFAATVSGGTKLPPELLTNLPPGEAVEPLPEPILQDPPVYLDVDSKGNIWTQRLVVDKFGNYQLSDVLVSQSTLDELGSQREIILQNMEDIDLPSISPNQGSSAASTSACPLPSSFGIWASATGQEAMGFVKVVNTYRPAGATTQWATFDFYTIRYRGRRSHLPVVLFHDEVVHGWGAFIGDNSVSPAGCGNSALFNSQIEGWTQYPDAPGYPPDPPGSFVPGGPRWQSHTFNGPNSCGNEMFDGPVIVFPYAFPRYRMEMQSSIDHLAEYRIQELKKSPLRWVELTDWKGIDVDTGVWDFPQPDPHPDWSGPVNPQGIWFLATPAATGAGSWSVNFVSTQCGWY